MADKGHHRPYRDHGSGLQRDLSYITIVGGDDRSLVHAPLRARDFGIQTTQYVRLNLDGFLLRGLRLYQLGLGGGQLLLLRCHLLILGCHLIGQRLYVSLITLDFEQAAGVLAFQLCVFL